MSIVSKSEDEDVSGSGKVSMTPGATGVGSEASFPPSMSSSSPEIGFCVVSSLEIESTCSATIIPPGAPSDSSPVAMMGPGTVKNSPEEIIGPWTGSKLNVPEEMIGPTTGSEEISPEEMTGPVIGRDANSPWEITGPVTGFENTKLPVETMGFEIGTETDGPEETISSVSVLSFKDSFKKRNSS